MNNLKENGENKDSRIGPTTKKIFYKERVRNKSQRKRERKESKMNKQKEEGEKDKRGLRPEWPDAELKSCPKFAQKQTTKV